MLLFCCQEQSEGLESQCSDWMTACQHPDWSWGHGASIPSEGELLLILRARKLNAHGQKQSVGSFDSSNNFEAPEVFNSILLERTEVGDVIECLFSSLWRLIQR